MTSDLEHVLAHTRGLWEDLRGRRIFVTGGTGFFGRWLLESFAYANRVLALEANMTVLSRDPATFAAKAPHLANDLAIQFIIGDVRRLQAKDAPNEQFDFVIHAATESSTNLGAEDPLLMCQTIVEGTQAALEFAVAKGARRFLFTSSGAVYGPQPSELRHVSEEYMGGPDCTQPSSAYGEGKRIAELLCACFHQKHGLETVIARCFAFVGPFLPLDAHFAIGNFLRDALAGGPIRVGGDGTPHRSYLHATDLTAWLWTILFKGQAGRCYNVGSEDDRSIKEIADMIARLSDISAVEIAKKPQVGKPASRYVPLVRRAREELQLEQWIGLPEAIQRTLAYLHNEK